VKNKLAPPFRQAEFDIIYGKGVSKEGSLIDVGVDTEIVKKAGAWFTYEGEQLGQGRENARQFLAEHKDVAKEIERKIRDAVGLTKFSDDDVVGIEDLPAPDKPTSAPAPVKAVPAPARAKAASAKEPAPTG
jgi:recombination protein RecA